MSMYRILKPLDYHKQVIPRGTVLELADLPGASIAVLLSRGAIAEIAGPPLTELPGWEVRAEKLARADIHTSKQLLDADVSTLAKQLAVSQATLRKWKQELTLDFLTVKAPSRASVLHDTQHKSEGAS